MFVGDEVRIDHEGDKDDGLIGTVLEIGPRGFLIQFADGSGGWYAESEVSPA